MILFQDIGYMYLDFKHLNLILILVVYMWTVLEMKI